MKQNSTDSTKTEWRKAAKGIRYRLHPTRKHGKQLDRYYVIRYSADGKKKQEAVGWAREGWSLDKVQEQIYHSKSDRKTGEGAEKLADKRRHAKERIEAAEVQRQGEERNG
mgnify:CR=1 FL=1